ncbi:GNAT family N-acetyltransferase [Sphingosinicella terrae]|uniref:GNAT family N-acetyltransferase n=1 Tax=Sphingosinicella terrae TaxID=2172047 RepID=UPI0013B36633|nr:GNAT family N-acetyltransferase [Sphingosinicella terrae]
MSAEVELFEDWETIAADAGGRLDRASQPSAYARLSWFRLIAEHCPPAGKLLAIRARDAAQRTWLFLAVEHPHAAAFAAWYSLRFDAVGDRSAPLLTAIAATLRHGGVARVELAPVEDPEPLRAAFAAAGWIASVTEKTGNWIVRTDGQDFETFWARRPARLRNTARRKAKAAGLDIQIFDRFDAGAWAEYESVYRASWKPDEGSFGFLRALAEQEGAAGTLRLGIARKDAMPVAAQLWLVENEEATIHKLAYREDAKSLSPGTILGEAMFRRALDQDRVRLIDYGTGDDGYKAEWMEERRPLWQLTAYNPRTIAGFAGAARAWASALAARRRSR